MINIIFWAYLILAGIAMLGMPWLVGDERGPYKPYHVLQSVCKFAAWLLVGGRALGWW